MTDWLYMNRYCRFGSAICTALLVMAGLTNVPAFASFETQLSAVHAAVKKGQHAQTAALLQRLGTSATLEDLRLSLLADALRQSGKEAEALGIYERIMKLDREWLPVRQAGFQYVLLAARLRGPSERAQLREIARGLDTPYQRGRALEALIDLHPAASRERSLAALEALRAYRSESAFYQEMAESIGLLKNIVGSPAGWAFTQDEWIEIIRAASREKLGMIVERALPLIRSSLGHHGGVLQVILQAEALALAGQKDRAMTLITQVIATPGLEQSLQCLGHQVRGDMLNAASRHREAMADYQAALQWKEPPVDMFAARYRLMRAAFNCEQDETGLAEAEVLCRNGVNMSLLPVHLFEMGLARFDQGRNTQAVPWFMLVARYFPGHHRADDALGYSAICTGTTSAEGKHLLELLENMYPHSFYVYWLDPTGRNAPLKLGRSEPAVAKKWKSRSVAWKALLKSPFDGTAREEIRKLLAAHPEDMGLFKIAAESAEATAQHNLTVAARS